MEMILVRGRFIPVPRRKKELVTIERRKEGSWIPKILLFFFLSHHGWINILGMHSNGVFFLLIRACTTTPFRTTMEGSTDPRFF